MTGPNIVLIVADDMGYGDLSMLNGGLSTTPALDQLYAESLVFDQHYSASPVCAPARAGMLTGRYPLRTGVIDTLEARGTDRLHLDETTIADCLAAGGYQTGLVGKWHTGSIGADYHPTRRGFGEFAGFRGGWQDYYDWTLDVGTATTHSARRADGRYLTDVITAEAIDFISRHAAEPFFLHVAYNAPHFPLQAPREAIGRHRRAGRTEAVATVYAMIELMDHGIAAIRQALADAGLEHNTVVIFTSDNGPDFGGSGEQSTERFNGGLAGCKALVLEGGIRLPLLVHWPDGMAEPRLRHDFVHLTDLYPSLLSVAGVRNVGRLPLDGIDQSNALLGREPARAVPRFWQWTRYEPLASSNAAMRDGRWKLVRPLVPGTWDVAAEDAAMDADIKAHPRSYPEPVELPVPDRDTAARRPAMLFDLESDPGETCDRAGTHPRLAARMADALDDWFGQVERDRRRHESD